jgi:hypothetical protein
MRLFSLFFTLLILLAACTATAIKKTFWTKFQVLELTKCKSELHRIASVLRQSKWIHRETVANLGAAENVEVDKFTFKTNPKFLKLQMFP